MRKADKTVEQRRRAEAAEARATAAEATVTALQEKLKLAEEALEPFSKAVEYSDTRAEKMGFAPSFDEYVVAWTFSFADMRRARTALSQIRSEK